MQFNSHNNGIMHNSNINTNVNNANNIFPAQISSSVVNYQNSLNNANNIVYNQAGFNNAKKQKKKMKPVKKVLAGIAIGLAGTTVIGTAAIMIPATISVLGKKSDYTSGNNSGYVYVDDSYSDNYGDFERINEVTSIEGFTSNTYLSLNGNSYSNIISELNSKGFDYTYKEYYNMDEILGLYNQSEYNKEARSNILNDSNKVDSEKLYNMVIHNNKVYMSGGVNSVNCFLSEMSDSQIREICIYMANYFNNSEKVDYFKLAHTLNNLKIFLNETSVSNAYVNEDLILSINPNMIELMEGALEIRGSIDEDHNLEDSILAHEFEHIIQHSSNDFDDSNGLEIGPFRRYDNVNVNSLYISWLLEGAADINSANKLNIDPYTYLKKIGYFNTYNLSRIFDYEYNNNGLLESVYTTNISDMYNKLALEDANSQKEFLEFIYSIELTQMNCNDFWEYYESKTGKTLSENEKLVIKKQIREEAIMKLTLNYYSGLVRAINNGSINDLETAFYFMRMWELDCYNHLQYSFNAESYEDSKDFVLWLDEINGIVCEGFANSLGTSKEDIEQRYKDYRMNIIENGSEKNNCDYSYLSNDKKEFIEILEASFDFNNFSKISDVADSIEDTSMTR